MKGRKTGGRTVDTPNKATRSLHQLVEEEAGAPLPVLLTRIAVKAMKEGDHQLAVNALSKAAAYTYPRLQAVTLETVEDPVFYPPLVVDIDGKATIPPNYPGVVIRITRDGTSNGSDNPPDHVISFQR